MFSCCCCQEWINCGSGEHCSQEITRRIEEIITLGYEEKKKSEEEERREEEKKKRRKEKRRKEKKRQKLRNIQRKRKSMVIINLNQAKLMNEENWIETETTEMRKNEKKRDKEENWRTGDEIAWWGMEEKKRRMKTATREKEGNVKEYWGNHHNGVIGIWRGRKEWGRRKRRESREWGRNLGKGRATDD